MKAQRDIMAASPENPKKVEFYPSEKGLRVKINIDRVTTVDRIATDDDKRVYAKYLPQEQPKKRGRPPQKAD